MGFGALAQGEALRSAPRESARVTVAESTGPGRGKTSRASRASHVSRFGFIAWDDCKSHYSQPEIELYRPFRTLHNAPIPIVAICWPVQPNAAMNRWIALAAHHPFIRLQTLICPHPSPLTSRP